MGQRSAHVIDGLEKKQQLSCELFKCEQVAVVSRQPCVDLQVYQKHHLIRTVGAVLELLERMLAASTVTVVGVVDTEASPRSGINTFDGTTARTTEVAQRCSHVGSKLINVR